MKPKDLLVDYLYMLRGHVRSLRNAPLPSAWQAASGRDVILIAGVYERWHFLRDIGEKLAPEGYRVHVVSSLGRNRTSLDRATSELHNYIRENHIQNAVIVGHSKGGLVGLRYLIDHGATNRVTKVIAIATPFSGTTIGAIARLRTIRDMLPDSPSIVQLKTFTEKNKLVSIFPAYDNHVWHPNGSVVEGAKNIRLKSRGHHAILFRDELHQHIIGAIKNSQ